MQTQAITSTMHKHSEFQRLFVSALKNLFKAKAIVDGISKVLRKEIRNIIQEKFKDVILYLPVAEKVLINYDKPSRKKLSNAKKGFKYVDCFITQFEIDNTDFDLNQKIEITICLVSNHNKDAKYSHTVRDRFMNMKSEGILTSSTITPIGYIFTMERSLKQILESDIEIEYTDIFKD